jgi:hypothetical protein
MRCLRSLAIISGKLCFLTARLPAMWPPSLLDFGCKLNNKLTIQQHFGYQKIKTVCHGNAGYCIQYPDTQFGDAP